ncbi:molybdate ABC transporter substrate-binding protein [Aurantiacibacter odishensis]|uniref:molybdate ABC transporter substrate-binding protein n=1 Tax=Aurantiacibacter odishensis TaxID=1155476 RepID=UPI000E748164|nr:molybdate ABC transporter substrate-binding protein [Aurantiacibacter odishensis]
MRGTPLLSSIAASFSAFLLACCAPAEQSGPVVLAASSMQEGLGAAAERWAGKGYERPVLSFASSSAVARQVSEGAPGDLVITSDDRWIDWLAERGALSGAPLPLVANSLVVVAPAGAAGPRSLEAFAADPDAGRLAIGEPDSVPAGEFARVALQSMGLWEALSSRLAPGENVRASLALVERGEAALGIVYSSDAAASDSVEVVETIDSRTHPAIIYYVAVAAGSRHPDTREFLEYLISPEGRAAIAEEGFSLP